LFNLPLLDIGIFVFDIGMIPYTKHTLQSRSNSHAHKFSVLLIKDAFFLLNAYSDESLRCPCVPARIPRITSVGFSVTHDQYWP